MTNEPKKRVNFADCYVLTNKRTKAFILSFLDKYLPHRQEYTDVYEVPQFSEQPEVVFNTAEKLIEYLEVHTNEVHAIYWYNGEEETVRGTMCLFTSDAQVILGIFCESLYPDTHNEDYYFKDLMEFAGNTIGLLEYETPAAHDTAEFLKRVQDFKQNK